MKKILPLLLFAFTCFTSKLSATNYYVSALIGSDSYSGTFAQPFGTIQKASNLTNPGDTVFIMNGIYLSTPTASQSIVTITRSGTPGNYITYKAYPGHTPKLQLVAGLNYQVWRAVAINASYIVFTGIEIEGANQNLTYADAYQTYQDYKNNIKDFNKISSFNCGSIAIGTTGTADHIIITNCKIHDTGGGVGASGCDYITIENNLVYNTCWYSMYAGSGISILNPTSSDAITGYKIFIRNNIVHDNKTLIPWEQINALSDGNGIILDVNVGNGGTTLPYVGRYLVANNVSYNNGGGGVHAYKAAHVDIINNTAYNNGTVVGYPEIDANQCSDVKIYNNIMYARTGGNCNGNDGGIYDYNVYYNGPSYKNGGHDLTANPQFVVAATDATANFQLKNISPAINNGSNILGQFSATDILGVARPIGFTSDMGAYEYATVIARNEIKLSQGGTEIINTTGSFDFGDVSSTSPKIVTFTIDNIGDASLNLTGSPNRIVVTGTGFSLLSDAPAVIAANSSTTFQVQLLPSSTAANYSGTISIANNDADENPYTFAISGYGYDGNKAVQTITFNPLPIKVIGDANFNPGATSSAGIIVSYASSNTGVATIVGGQIHLVNSGTSTITASQPGDAITNPARSVTQLLTVTPVLPPPGTNMVTNPTFDVNTSGWSFSNKNSATSIVESVPMAGSSTNVGKVTITNLGTTTSSDNVQLSTNVFLVKDRNYLITFKANADAARAIGLRILQNASPFATIFTKTINITATQATYGFYAYTSTYTGSVALRFFLGNSNIPTYFDDVEMVEEVNTTLPISLLTFTGTLAGNKAILDWQTTSEINAKEFSIEKSTDGSTFTTIGNVQAVNNVSGANYKFTDATLKNGVSYYRLKYADKDGTSKYSKVVTLKLDGLKVTGIKIFPNPVSNYCSVSYPLATTHATLGIITADGKKINEYTVATGSTQRSVDVSNLSAGQYFIVYKNDNQTTSTSFIK